MLYRGSCFEVQKCERQTLHNAELVEVVFDSEGAVETLADAETEQFNFHIVWTLDGSCLPRINKSIRRKYIIYTSTTMRRTSSINAILVWSCAAALDLRWWKLDPSYKTLERQKPQNRVTRNRLMHAECAASTPFERCHASSSLKCT